jgi:Ni/Co efflux regulator RcnB
MEADMKKFLALVGVATALVVAAPMAAQAGSSYRHVERDGPRGGHYERDVYRHNDRHDYRQMKRHSFNHWRPGLERRHYRGFGRPAYHGHYYRVRAHDRHGRLVLLTINAYTGVILSVGY